MTSAPGIEPGREVTRPRPGHADLVGGMKFEHRDLRNVLERSSARETAARTAAGGLAKELLCSFEVVFHVVTMMPTVEGDDQQITKKRHVGNDIVHVVWSEHSHDYHPTTITSQFNDAHIVVYPLPNGMCRVRVHSKPQV